METILENATVNSIRLEQTNIGNRMCVYGDNIDTIPKPFTVAFINGVPIGFREVVSLGEMSNHDTTIMKETVYNPDDDIYETHIHIRTE